MGHPRQLVGFDDNLWDLIRESGCRRILVGAESGDQEILDLINKDATVQDMMDFVRQAKRHKIIPILSTMAGFPGSSRRDLFKTIKLAVKAKRLYQETEWKLFLYTPYPGTELYDLAVKYGMKEPANLLDWSEHTLREVKTPWIKDSFRAGIRHIAFFYFQAAYPSKLIQEKIDRAGFNFLIKAVFKTVQFMARIRLTINFYSFPVEPLVYNFLKRKRWLNHITLYEQRS